MATVNLSQPASRPKLMMALVLLLLVQYVGVGILLPLHAFTSPFGTPALRVLAVCLALFGLFTIYTVWAHKPWAAWPTLVLVAFKLTVDLYFWALNLDRWLTPLNELVNGSIIVLVCLLVMPPSVRVPILYKIFFVVVLLFAANVGLRGMLEPTNIVEALPFSVPPLHARFLGAMYLSGATFMALGIGAKNWYAIRVVLPMVAIWTGLLGVVSLFHLEAFDWSRVQVWGWFVAYTSFPLIGAWIAWQQRSVHDHATTAPLSSLLRAYFAVQGVAVSLFALCLLFAPSLMTAIWPWAITPMLAQIYSAPFLSYGVGSLLVARQVDWAEVRIVVYATLVFTSSVLLGSLLASHLFVFNRPAAWVWFGGFTLATLALILFSLIPALRAQIPALAYGRMPTTNS